MIALREWSRLAEELQQERVRLGNRIRQQLWRYYPQLLAVSDDVTAEWVLDLWTLAPTPAKGRTPARDDAGPAASEAPDPPGRSRAGGWPLASARDPSG